MVGYTDLTVNTVAAVWAMTAAVSRRDDRCVGVPVVGRGYASMLRRWAMLRDVML